jgi:hypothetical protein
MHPPTHLVCPHQQLLAPYLTQVLDNLHVSSTTGAHEAGPAILHTLAVRSPARAVCSTPGSDLRCCSAFSLPRPPSSVSR